jgi:2-keto-4-pentenoate hydratase
MTNSINQAAARLRTAQTDLRPCPPVRELLEPGDVESAYAVQMENTSAELAAGRRRIGWKIGLTSPAVQQQLGVDRPDFGMLFADTEVLDDIATDGATLLQPRVEAEVAFVLGSDLDIDTITSLDVIRATEFVLPAIEIVDSRVAGWDITILDTIADNASGAAFVLGAHPVTLSHVDLREVAMTMTGTDGSQSTGSGAACLGHPVNAVVWLATTLRSVGSPLRAGDLVLSGALGPMVPVTYGSTYEATITGLGSVRARFDAR